MSYSDDKPDFNMAVLYLERLNKRLDERDQTSLVADNFSWYRTLKAIYRNIHFKILEDKEYESVNSKLNDMFSKAKNLLESSNNKLMGNIGISKAEQTLDELDQYLNDLMYKYNLIFPKKMFETFLDEIEGDY